jgi:hypothetical protein
MFTEDFLLQTARFIGIAGLILFIVSGVGGAPTTSSPSSNSNTAVAFRITVEQLFGIIPFLLRNYGY